MTLRKTVKIISKLQKIQENDYRNLKNCEMK